MAEVRRIPGVKGHHRQAVLDAYPGKPGKCRCHQYQYRYQCNCDGQRTDWRRPEALAVGFWDEAV